MLYVNALQHMDTCMHARVRVRAHTNMRLMDLVLNEQENVLPRIPKIKLHEVDATQNIYPEKSEEKTTTTTEASEEKRKKIRNQMIQIKKLKHQMQRYMRLKH